MKPLSFFLLLVLCGARTFAQTDTVHKSADTADLNRIFLKVEIESKFPGGTPGWNRYLATHLTYPIEAIGNRIQGTVILQFIVDKDGTVSDLTVVSGDPILAKAALKAMATSPNWVPAVQDGKPVKSYKKQPFIFRIQVQ